jgi:hypothetical protein
VRGSSSKSSIVRSFDIFIHLCIPILQPLKSLISLAAEKKGKQHAEEEEQPPAVNGKIQKGSRCTKALQVLIHVFQYRKASIYSRRTQKEL